MIPFLYNILSMKNTIKYRYIGRKEYFGSIFFDREQSILIPFDHLGTAIFDALSEYSPSAVKKAFKQEISEDNIDAFFEKWQNMELLDDKFKFRGKTLPDRSCKSFLSAPLKIYMDFTYKCNLRCIHCLTSSGMKAKKEIDTDSMKKLLTEMNDAGIFEINVGGGEPLTRKDAVELLGFASDLEICIDLLTNGTLIDIDLANQLKDIKLRSIAISLDGATRETHDSIRGKGSYKNVLKSIKILSSIKRHNLYLHMTLMRHNIKELKAFVNLSEELSVDSFGISFVRYQGRAKTDENIMIKPDEYNQILNEAIEISKNTEKPFYIKTFLPGVDDEGSSRLYSGFGCGAARVNCSLDASGNLVPCNFFNMTGKPDNVFDKGLVNIWQNNQFFNLLRNLSGNDKCLSCKHFTDCRGGCRAQAEQLFGDINAPDYYCLNQD